MSVRPDADAAATAATLAEALPYIRRFLGAVIVVKFGGSTLAAGDLDSASVLAEFAQDVVLMRSVGMLPVVVHGGGPQIGALMEALGKTPEFRDGQRVTDAETLDIARMVLVGKVNREIVGALNLHAPIAVGLSGEDGGFITAVERDPALGFVGDVESVDPVLLRHLLAEGLVPVVATIAPDATGQAYNVNADAVAGAIAESLGARRLIFLTDVPGVRARAEDPSSVLSTTSAVALEALVDSGGIVGGMIPKARACARAVRDGVEAAHILDGRIEHALLLELFTESGVGTMVVGS
ncbi:MAG TPA: acetylglutamate kinase [Acidimicrobiales bacterium]|nr:acetylglutamate kinase [Acidimicrobiales bacterium]